MRARKGMRTALKRQRPAPSPTLPPTSLSMQRIAAEADGSQPGPGGTSGGAASRPQVPPVRAAMQGAETHVVRMAQAPQLPADRSCSGLTD